MPEGWTLLVQEKEYGPVSFETLLEWKREGRVLPDNPVRRDPDDDWSTAAEIPGLFGPPPLPPPVEPTPIHHRTVGEILLETVRLYRKGFFFFVFLAFLFEIPAFLLRISIGRFRLPRVEPGGRIVSGETLPPEALWTLGGLVVLLLLAWAFYIAGLQRVVATLARGDRPRFRSIVAGAARFWPRVLGLCLMVSGAYMFWSVLPLLIIFSILTQPPTLATIFLALALLALQAYMTGRLFINFLFWQQCAVLEDRRGVFAIRESRDLARNRVRLDFRQRPIFRGALLVSLWLLVLLIAGTMVEMPFVLARFGLITDMGQAMAEIEKMAQNPVTDSLMFWSYVASGAVSAVIKPLLGIAFAVLYFDARSDFPAADR